MSLTHAFAGAVIGLAATTLIKFAQKYFAVTEATPAMPISAAIKEALKEEVIEIEKKLPDLEKVLEQEIKDDIK